MREEKPNLPSPRKTSVSKKGWFWPSIYAGFSLLLVGMIWGYNAYIANDGNTPSEWAGAQNEKDPVIETNAKAESMKYPFKEELFDDVAILQDYYDMEADEKTRESALLVFNQTFTTSSGISLSVNGEPFEVLAAMSGVIEEVKMDPFIGNQVVITHANGMTTRYESVSEIAVKKGDKVSQGQVLGKAAANEWNPTAGVHLHFQVYQDGKPVNPKKMLAFSPKN